MPHKLFYQEMRGPDGIQAINEAFKKAGEASLTDSEDNEQRATVNRPLRDWTYPGHPRGCWLADRDASIRIPRHVSEKGYGYRGGCCPASNASKLIQIQLCTVRRFL